MFVVDAILLLISLLLLVSALVYFVECMVAVFRGRPSELATTARRPVAAVVVPAHNEEACIRDSVTHIKEQLAPGERLIVVADNCTDHTAEEARGAGAEVWVRVDAAHCGKGYAISFAVERLAGDAPEVVVFVDADCRLAEGTIDTISRAAIANQRPIQSKYLFIPPSDSGSIGSVSALACLVRNLVRPLGLHHLGVPCHLTGSGMAFPWDQIHNAPAQCGSIVEDLSLGLDLVVAGHEPMLCSEAVISSSLPRDRNSAAVQRRRWEHGQIATFASYAPRLVAQGVREKRPKLVALAADLAVPPLALLVLLVCLTTMLAAGAHLLGGSIAPAIVSAASLALVFVATLSAWALFGRETISAVRLMAVPLYVLWKLPSYIALLGGRKEKVWIRTPRAKVQGETPVD